jgi:hypothetical protein
MNAGEFLRAIPYNHHISENAELVARDRKGNEYPVLYAVDESEDTDSVRLYLGKKVKPSVKPVTKKQLKRYAKNHAKIVNTLCQGFDSPEEAADRILDALRVT